MAAWPSTCTELAGRAKSRSKLDRFWVSRAVITVLPINRPVLGCQVSLMS